MVISRFVLSIYMETSYCTTLNLHSVICQLYFSEAGKKGQLEENF